MANKPIKLKINVTKILKEHLFKANSGAVYLDCAVWPNKDGRGQYGDTHYVVQDISREEREAGTKAPIIGNLAMPEEDVRPAPRTTAAKVAAAQEDDGSDIPF
jgi:hypothetical protein